MSDEVKACGMCRYSLMGVQGSPEHGLCLRYPPSIDGLRPDVAADDWCGEYTPSDSNGGGA